MANCICALMVAIFKCAKEQSAILCGSKRGIRTKCDLIDSIHPINRSILIQLIYIHSIQLILFYYLLLINYFHFFISFVSSFSFAENLLYMVKAAIK
uniref:Secreted protein n=1 Tax=Brugia timori TaxID=42155 RepID=A0A0R3R9A0_9BILA